MKKTIPLITLCVLLFAFVTACTGAQGESIAGNLGESLRGSLGQSPRGSIGESLSYRGFSGTTVAPPLNTRFAGSQDDGGSILGRYILVSITEDGVDYTQDYIEWFGIDSLFIEFNSGNTFEISFFGERTQGTYTQSGNRLMLTAEGDTIEATISGSRITINDFGAIIVFQKG